MPGPPADLVEGASLFLDLDGTLLDLVDRPQDAVADDELVDLLGRASERMEGRIALVTGRSVDQVDAILGDIAGTLNISGSHGCEHRWRDVLATPVRPESLDKAAEQLGRFADAHDGVLLECKSFGVALHYRMRPEVMEDAHALVARLGEQPGLVVQHGKMMVELRVGGGDKGQAVRLLMGRAPMKGSRPLFIGDDLTDEAGFVAAQEFGGHGILVGEPRPTAADYGIWSPADLRRWLAGALS